MKLNLNKRANTQLSSTQVCEKLASLLMRDGKKNIVLKVIYAKLQEYTSANNLCMLTSLVYKLKPSLETKKIRKGAKHFDVPFPVSEKRSLSLALKWFANGVAGRHERKLRDRVAGELTDLILKRGLAFKEAQQLRKKVCSNSHYSHYRWK